jgi:hypothetical protein
MSQDKLKITPEQAQKMCETIKELELEVPEWFGLLTYEELAECYNGAGSDKTPKLIRKVLTRLLGFAKEAVLIHDAEYQYASRFWPVNYYTQNKFHTANLRLGENAEILAKERTSWYLPLRYCWRLFVACQAPKICNEWGYDAWISK